MRCEGLEERKPEILPKQRKGSLKSSQSRGRWTSFWPALPPSDPQAYPSFFYPAPCWTLAHMGSMNGFPSPVILTWLRQWNHWQELEDGEIEINISFPDCLLQGLVGRLHSLRTSHRPLGKPSSHSCRVDNAVFLSWTPDTSFPFVVS